MLNEIILSLIMISRCLSVMNNERITYKIHNYYFYQNMLVELNKNAFLFEKNKSGGFIWFSNWIKILKYSRKENVL